MLIPLSSTGAARSSTMKVTISGFKQSKCIYTGNRGRPERGSGMCHLNIIMQRKPRHNHGWPVWRSSSWTFSYVSEYLLPPLPSSVSSLRGVGAAVHFPFTDKNTRNATISMRACADHVSVLMWQECDGRHCGFGVSVTRMPPHHLKQSGVKQDSPPAVVSSLQ